MPHNAGISGNLMHWGTCTPGKEESGFTASFGERDRRQNVIQKRGFVGQSQGVSSGEINPAVIV